MAILVPKCSSSPATQLSLIITVIIERHNIHAFLNIIRSGPKRSECLKCFWSSLFVSVQCSSLGRKFAESNPTVVLSLTYRSSNPSRIPNCAYGKIVMIIIIIIIIIITIIIIIIIVSNNNINNNE